MRRRDGFTVIELIVAIAVMGILLTIATVSYRSSQVNARDRERQADVQSIANHLERLYASEIKSGSTVIKRAGSYPSTAILNSTTYSNIVFDELPQGATYAPNSSAVSFIRATTLTPSPTVSQYYYVPLQQSGGALCTAISQECRAFQIRYRLESDEIITLESKRA